MTKRIFLWLLPFSLLTTNTYAFDHSHGPFDSILQTYVNDKGQVDYMQLKRNRDPLTAYLKTLASVSAQETNQWTREQKLAYWMNAYNAYTLDTILNHIPITRSKGLKYRLYPENSIRQIPGVWDRIRHQAGGKLVTLGEIEHEILRRELKEPRIHFTIVCASVGCPVLRDSAYTAAAVEEDDLASFEL